MNKATTANAVLLAGLLAAWLIVFPCIFALMYSVIEMQSSARVAVGANTKLASFSIVRIADRIKFLNKNLEMKKAEHEKAIRDGDIFDATVVTAGEYSREMIGGAAKLLWGQGNRRHPCDLGMKCLQEVLIESTQRTWEPNAETPKQIETARMAYDQFQKLIFKQVSNNAATKDLAKTIHEMEDELADYSRTGPGHANANNAEDAHAVALSYNEQRQFPFFELLFFLPAGVVIAFFTGLMGAIGAAIYSLYSQLNPKLVEERGTPLSLAHAYCVRPLLGALAGFTVFFVASAGASFLIQPGAASATQAVNQLSPPALASLGIFSGLASERALGWLIGKAHSFFQTDSCASPRSKDEIAD